MSSTKRIIERQEEEDELKAALQALLADERIKGDVAIGIAKFVISTGNTDQLSERQKWVFEHQIKPEMTIACQDCGDTIPLISYPDVIGNPDGEICDNCRRIDDAMSKD